MFKKISDAIPRPEWQKKARYECLDIRDKLLDGEFYDHLPHAFYDEKDGSTAASGPVPLSRRRPSSQYRLPRMVARWSSRKLFAGRHVPKVMTLDPTHSKQIETLVAKGNLYKKMMDVVIRGSVGSVGVTFSVDTTDSERPKVALKVWPAKYCKPMFDGMGDLEALSVRYTVRGHEFIEMGYEPGVDFKPDAMYWFIRDYGSSQEVTYEPVLESLWNPVQGFKSSKVTDFVPWVIIDHDLGFCPAHWFLNLSGGDEIDGACTFEDAIPIGLELDYLLSQTSRGTRYNCAPQLTVTGELIGSDDDDGHAVTRDIMSFIHLQASRKDEDGNTVGGGDAKLLEMQGSGIEVSLKLIDVLHKYAMELIAASRKDPEKIKGALSAKAMEYMDEDSFDLVMELRSNYGEYGFLPLLRKIVATAHPDIDVSTMSLHWPRLYSPTPDDILTLVNALVIASAPSGGASGNSGKTGQPGQQFDQFGKPKVATPSAATGPSLITIAQAQMIIQSALDLNLLDIDGEGVSDITTMVQEKDPSPPINPDADDNPADSGRNMLIPVVTTAP